MDSPFSNIKIPEFLTKPEGIVKTILALIVIVLVLTIGYKIYKKLKNAPVNKKYDGSNIPSTWNPMPLVEKLYSSMHGWNFSVDEEEYAWKQLSELATSDMVIVVYNEWNNKYQGEEGKTLTKMIRDEWGAVFGSFQNSALTRLESLNLP